MGNDVSSSKGFFLAVIVLLALAVFVSYFGDSNSGDSTAGQAIRSQGPGNQEPRCTTTWTKDCSVTMGMMAFGSAKISEADARADANLQCNTFVQARQSEFNNCMIKNINDCPSLSSIPPSLCKLDITDRTNTLGPCTIKSCMYASGHQSSSDDNCKFRLYQYDQNGRRIEPGRCFSTYPYRSSTGYVQPPGTWECTSSDGDGATATFNCHP